MHIFHENPSSAQGKHSCNSEQCRGKIHNHRVRTPEFTSASLPLTGCVTLANSSILWLSISNYKLELGLIHSEFPANFGHH